MFAEERQGHILTKLRQAGKVTVDELAQTLGVSAPTVRADLAALESRRLLRRTHGGAIGPHTSIHEPPYAERAEEQADEKRRIGQAAAQTISPGETVLLDAGTTCYEIALALQAVPPDGVTVVTNNLPAALLLQEAPTLTVLLVGGQIQPRRRATLGPLAADFLRPIHADRVFLGVSGVDADAGITAADFEAAHIKRVMIAQSAHIAVVADSSKCSGRAFAHVAPLSIVHHLFTDTDLSDETEAALTEAGLAQITQV